MLSGYCSATASQAALLAEIESGLGSTGGSPFASRRAYRLVVSTYDAKLQSVAVKYRVLSVPREGSAAGPRTSSGTPYQYHLNMFAPPRPANLSEEDRVHSDLVKHWALDGESGC